MVVRAGRAMWRTKQKRDLDWKSGWNGLPSALVDSNAVMPFDDWMKIVGHLSDEVEEEGNAIGWEDVSRHSFLCQRSCSTLSAWDLGLTCVLLAVGLDSGMVVASRARTLTPRSSDGPAMVGKIRRAAPILAHNVQAKLSSSDERCARVPRRNCRRRRGR